MPSITNLATTAALTAVENKIPDVSNLIKKPDYDTKFNEIENKIIDHSHDKYINIPEMNKLTAGNFAARLAEVNLETKTDFDNKLINLDKKLTQAKTKHLIIKNHFKKLETFDSICFCGKSHFEDDGTRNYLVFQATYRYFKTYSFNGSNVLSWKS